MAPKRRKQAAESEPRRLSLVSLGCAKNTVDSESALGQLLGDGYELSVNPEDAHLILINTCGFLQSARDESYSVIEEMLALKDRDGFPKVVAMGCLSEHMGRQLGDAYPGLDGVFPLAAYTDLSSLCEQILSGARLRGDLHLPSGYSIPEGPRLLITGNSYAYLKVADGCDNRCSYCAIPDIRGPFHSRPRELIVNEARRLTDMGVRELVLVAQDTTRFGEDLPGSENLSGLLEQLLADTEADRIRIMYAHPAHISDEVIALLAGEARLCSYIDLPIQHVNSAILSRMNRGYDREQIESVLQKLRSGSAGMVIRTTVITGFPGESDTEFQELLDFVGAGHFQNLGAFAYSPEQGTPAFDYSPMISEEERLRRKDAILAAQQEVAFAWLDSRLGSTVDLLIDRQVAPDLWSGRSVSEAPDVDGIIEVEGTEFCSGDIIRACLDTRNNYDIQAVSV